MFFTVLETVLLCCTGMPLFDSLVNTFGTVGTGGFSVKNASIGAYANPAAEWIIGIFMLICGTNFNIFYFLLIRQFREIRKNEELRVYLLLSFAATAAIAVNTWQMFAGAAGDCIRTAFFQVATMMSTSGFSTVNFDLWPSFSKTILVILMITGASAGSTAGGLKLSRVLILFKSVWREIKHMLRPRSVNVLRLDGDPIPEETSRSALGYLAIYCLIFVASIFLVSVDGFDFETNVTGVLACFNNIGPGFSVVGPMGNFGGYSVFSKLVLSLDMLFGRLEIMPMLILFSPAAWKRR
jgi:trk system potassium uptake protein TrkH